MSNRIQIPVVPGQHKDLPVFSPHSESDNESDIRLRAQEDASILYSRPQAVRNKTRTFSEVSTPGIVHYCAPRGPTSDTFNEPFPPGHTTQSGGAQTVIRQRNVYSSDNLGTRSRRMSHGKLAAK